MSTESFQIMMMNQIYRRDTSREYIRDLDWRNWADWAKDDYIEKHYVEFFEEFFFGNK